MDHVVANGQLDGLFLGNESFFVVRHDLWVVVVLEQPVAVGIRRLLGQPDAVGNLVGGFVVDSPHHIIAFIHG